MLHSSIYLEYSYLEVPEAMEGPLLKRAWTKILLNLLYYLNYRRAPYSVIYTTNHFWKLKQYASRFLGIVFYFQAHWYDEVLIFSCFLHIWRIMRFCSYGGMWAIQTQNEFHLTLVKTTPTSVLTCWRFFRFIACYSVPDVRWSAFADSFVTKCVLVTFVTLVF